MSEIILQGFTLASPSLSDMQRYEKPPTYAIDWGLKYVKRFVKNPGHIRFPIRNRPNHL